MENEFKICPYCGEKIPKETKKCKHCGESLTVETRKATEEKKKEQEKAEFQEWLETRKSKQSKEVPFISLFITTRGCMPTSASTSTLSLIHI